MGGRNQSQVKIELKSSKKLSPFRKHVPKSHNDDKVVPKDTGSVHGFGREVSLDLGGQSEHHVTDGFLVIILPILDFVLVRIDVLFRRRVFSGQGDSSTIQGDIPGAWPREYTPLTLSLGARGPGNQRKHLEYIAGSG